MTLQFSAKHCWLLAVLALVTAAPLAEERLIINVSKVKRSPSSSNTIHYQGTGSVRHSEQRTYEKAQSRHSVQAAESRNEVQQAGERRTASAQERQEVQGAEDRTYSRATDRHGSVRLDTIR
jgi:hypothetical protein